MDWVVGVDVDDGTLGPKVWLCWRRVGVERREKSLVEKVVCVSFCGVNWGSLLDWGVVSGFAGLETYEDS